MITRIGNIDCYLVDTQAEMLSLAAERGCVVIRQDMAPDGVFVLSTSPANVLDSWVQVNGGGGGGGGIPATLLDAKGDVIVASAADTAARLAAGANNEVLTADSTQPLGVGWKPTAQIASTNPLRHGRAPAPGTLGTLSDAGHVHHTERQASHLVPIGPALTLAGIGGIQVGALSRGTAGQGMLVPVHFDAELPVDHLALFVETAGTAGSLIRVGLYEDAAAYRDHNGGARIADCGTTPVAGSVTAANNMVSWTIPGGFTPRLDRRYWAAVVWETALATQPTVYYIWPTFALPGGSLDRGGGARLITGATSGLPATADLTWGVLQETPRFWFRAA